LPVAPMQLLALEHGREWEPVAALGPDGVIQQGISKRGPAAVFRIAGDEVFDMSGVSKMRCERDRTLRFAGTNLAMRFDERDALVASDGTRIYVRDSGEVEMALAGPTRVMPWRVAGISPGLRRSAELLVFATVASINWH